MTRKGSEVRVLYGPPENPEVGGRCPAGADAATTQRRSREGDVRVLVTGATGYIGGRLAPRLLEQGRQVRCLVRDPARLRDVPWAADAEVVAGDVLDPASCERALNGCQVAYYLVHQLGSGPRFAERDRRAASVFAAAARAAGVERLVYLGGLAPREEPLSPHLASRLEVGDLLLGSGVPTAVLRAAVVIGSGSASFEMLRYLTERLPVMVTPRWVRNRVQPIAVRDVLHFLLAAADLPASVSRAFDVGGPEVLTYLAMMQRYAAVAGLRRRVVVPVPVLTPRLSSHWMGVVTPVPAELARPLVESLRHEVVCAEDDLVRLVGEPEGGLLPFEEAVALALARVRDHQVTTRWSSATLPGTLAEPLPSDPAWTGGTLLRDEREVTVGAPAEALWPHIEGIGGEHGWYSWPLAWAARGWLDRLFGGVGLARGRRDPDRLVTGDSVDFWRVEELVPGRRLRLRAEMRLPGSAWLELEVEPLGPTRCRYRQRALFAPRGLAGHLYWWAIAPFHEVIFGSMATNLAARAEGRGPVVPRWWRRRRRPGTGPREVSLRPLRPGEERAG
ncbi:SDR family oxidoreductase [Aciditerrimonas ferrireducens]|uniref:SDR family oxidoreductase n=1 Tax=Aciditerrimonas ferrireducens TaxID=667306 RepID=A0ABV6BZM0_9ACTN